MGSNATVRHCLPYCALILIFVLMQVAGMLMSPSMGEGKNPVLTVTGTNQDDRFGWNVSSAGDVNGDGYDDIIVGAPGYNLSRGRAYIFFGGPWFSGLLKAKNANITLTGTAPGDRFGWDVSGAGDVNRDGFDDVIVGAPGRNKGVGSSYLFYGKKTSVTALKAINANSTYLGEDTGHEFGSSVSWAGDVNNDGYDDIIIGAPYYNGWWDRNWTNRIKLTFDNSEQSEDLYNFPVLINLSSPIFDYSKANLDGTDLRFIDDDGKTELNYHIEVWDPAGYSHVWVNVTKIDANSETDHVWMYYGNTAASDTQDPMKTYDSDYVGVWHLNETVIDEAMSGVHYDSTSYNNHGSQNKNDDILGKIAYGQFFDGTDDKVHITDDPSLQIVDMTLEAWVYILGIIPMNWSTIIEHDRSDVNWYGLWKSDNGNVFHFRWSTGTVRRTDFTSPIIPNSWYYVAGVLNTSSSTAYGYLNGDIDITVPGADPPTPSPGFTRFGSSGNGTEDFSGIIDEVRISKKARSADWIRAQYFSMNGSFVVFGEETVLSQVPGAAYIFLGNKTLELEIKAAEADTFLGGERGNFGFSVSSAGNVNNDQYDDVIIGAPGVDKAYVYFGGNPMNAWVQTSQADFDSAEKKIHINTTRNMDGEVQLASFYNIKAMMAYFDGSNPPDTPEVPKNRTWDQSFWREENKPATIGIDENYWFALRSSTTRKNEKILVISDAGRDLNIQVSDGLSWNHVMELDTVSKDMKFRGFDVAYESKSGNAVFAYFNDSSPSKLVPKYRIWDGNSWSSEMDAEPVGTADIQWIVLASNPLKDEIMMLTLDKGNRDIYAQVWNGTAWGNVQLIESQASRDDNLCFDAVYEQQSGYGMIVWGGDSGSNKNLNYRRWTGDWSEMAGTMTAADNQVNVVKLAADPRTDYIISGNLDNGKRIDVQIWNGKGWSAVREVAPGNAERSAEHCFDVAYEATGDRGGIVVYGIDDHRPAYRLINGTSVGPEGFVLEANPPDNGRKPNWILLESDPQTRNIMLTYIIDDGGGNGGAEDDIGCEVWNGTEWILPQRVELNSTRDNGQCFDMAYTDTSGYLISAPYDALTAGTWGRIRWTAKIPRQTDIQFRTRTSSDGNNWSAWSDWLDNGDRIGSPANRWIQYEAYFETTNVGRTPILYDVSIELNRANLTLKGTPQEGFGWSVSNTGDLQDDGYDDMIVGAPFNGSANGSAYIFSGARVKTEGDGDRFINLTNGDTANVTLIGDVGDDRFGYSVSRAGNVSSDNYPDVVVGAPGAQKSGTIYIFFGSPSMDPVLPVSDADALFTGDGELECFGWSVTLVGNISSTGYDEVAVGAPFYDDMSKTDAGRVYIINFHYRPDISINGNVNDEYQVIPAGLQVNVSWVTPGNNITFYIKVENDGTLPDTYDLNITTGMLAGWFWNITDNITAEEILDGHSITLLPGENRTFTLNVSVPISTFHGEESWVTVTAVSQNDTVKKDAVKAVVRALDVTPPEILDTTSGTPSTGDIFVISTTVTDDVIVNNVYLYYCFDLFDGGMDGPYNVTMDPGYTKDITAPTNATVLYYNISVNDTSDNWNETGEKILSVLDNDLPALVDITSGSPTTGDQFVVTVAASDNIQIVGVHVLLWFETTGGPIAPVNLSMNDIGGGNFQRGINVPANALVLHYKFSANDTSDNWNETGFVTLNVVDNDGPNIIDTTSDSPTTGDLFSITASTTDNIEVGEVQVYFGFDLYGGGTDGPYNISMDP
ncbi:MAG: DUF2341 domain-containing protein, partial [Thermoplasmata archaeon]